MIELNYIKPKNENVVVSDSLLKNKRKLTTQEIAILKSNYNRNEDSSWGNFYVDAENFDASLIHNSYFSGFIILGKILPAKLKYHDLELEVGIYNSKLKDVVVGDDVSITNVAYLENYRIGNRVMLFNIMELCCTKHAKFGNGILKEGEEESHRVWLGVANENEGRSVLPFEDMIAADAYLWSHYREDDLVLYKFKEFTELGNTKKLDTFGFIADDVVIKNSNIIKDAKIFSYTYIKGAFKLKNITILSSKDEPSQVGEGVEMVNGILGYGSKIFYQAVAVRFVIGRNCQVKYGARLLNSVLGDNSTVSCCEVLNNLIFPFHEQHHNSSFLIASTVMGQSNIASGATIGSNHNSRSPDGEIFAKRGFWPGLCSDFKHNSRFASFALVSKGSYQYELDISYPFALVTPAQKDDMRINIIPAWWFMYDMFAIARNKNKFIKRDKRVVKVQHIETDPFAPDTMQEVLSAIARIIDLTSDYLKQNDLEALEGAQTPQEILQAAKDFLHQNPEANFVLFDSLCQKRYGANICKPVQAYKMYRKIIKYFATSTLLDYCKLNNSVTFTREMLENVRQLPLYTSWENVGGQIIPSDKVQELFELIRNSKINSWQEVHDFYDECQKNYFMYKVRYSIYLLEQLYSRPIEEFSEDLYRNIIGDVTVIAFDIYTSSVQSREKDYTDYFRTMTYHSLKEMEKVIGPLNDNSFLIELRNQTEDFTTRIKNLFDEFILN